MKDFLIRLFLGFAIGTVVVAVSLLFGASMPVAGSIGIMVFLALGFGGLVIDSDFNFFDGN